MKHTRKRAGYAGADCETITEFAKELNITPVLNKLQEYRRNWLERVNRMLHYRLRRILKKLQTKQAKETRGDR